MPLIQSQIKPVGSDPLVSPFATHEDIFGKGGYVAIETTTDKPLINNHIQKERLKAGMLVYDNTQEKYYRCDSVALANPLNDANWVEENFGSGSSDISIDGGVGINVTESQTNEFTISLNANLFNLTDVIPGDTIQSDKPYFFKANIPSVAEGDEAQGSIKLQPKLLKLNSIDDVQYSGTPAIGQALVWNGTKWGPATIQGGGGGGSTDGDFALLNSPYVIHSTDYSLPNALLLDNGFGILKDTTTDNRIVFSIDTNEIVLYDDMPQYTDGTLDVARQSTLLLLLDILNSFGTTECPFGGAGDGGILNITGGLGILVNDVFDQPRTVVVSVDDTIVATQNNTLNLTNKRYNGLRIFEENNALNLIYDDLDIDLSIIDGSTLRFKGVNVSNIITFKNRVDIESYIELSVAYEQDLFLSKLQDVAIAETDLEDGNLLSYNQEEQKWTNIGVIFGGSASSF